MTLYDDVRVFHRGDVAWTSASFNVKGRSVAGESFDKDGRVIPGLYAAGETVGIYHQVYTGSTSVLRGAVFGRLAGRHAATALR